MALLTWIDFAEKYDDPAAVEKFYFEPPWDLQVGGGAAEQSRPSSDTAAPHHVLIESDNYPALKKLAGAAANSTASYLATTSETSPSLVAQPTAAPAPTATAPLSNSIHLIYIDPPYNTGKDFTYKDNFSSANDRHDRWLAFMSRRLSLAQKLLRPDGCIFIAIGQEELFTLKILCDQIFGEDNFINDFEWLHGKGKKDKWSRTLQQHTLCYAKDKTKLRTFREIEKTDWASTNADSDPRGNWFSGSISFSEKRSNPNHKNYFSITSPSGKVWTRQWLKSKAEIERLLSENKIFFGPAPDYDKVPREKIFNNTEKEIIPKNIIDCVDSTRHAQAHLDKLLGQKGLFDNPKPVDLIEHLIKIAQMPPNALIMDFFAGSGTTFEAVCRLNAADKGNRRCILIQKDEGGIADVCRKRCQKVAEIYREKITFVKLTDS